MSYDFDFSFINLCFPLSMKRLRKEFPVVDNGSLIDHTGQIYLGEIHTEQGPNEPPAVEPWYLDKEILHNFFSQNNVWLNIVPCISGLYVKYKFHIMHLDASKQSIITNKYTREYLSRRDAIVGATYFMFNVLENQLNREKNDQTD